MDAYAADTQAGEGVPNVIPIRFETRQENDPEKKGEVREEDWVMWAKKGVQNQAHTGDAIRRVKKNNALWAVLKPYYEQWKAGAGGYVDGTPIDQFKGIPDALAGMLRGQFRIMSVEDFANLTDGELPKVRYPNVRAFRDKARVWVEEQKAKANLADELAKRDKQLAEMQKKLDALETKKAAKK